MEGGTGKAKMNQRGPDAKLRGLYFVLAVLRDSRSRSQVTKFCSSLWP